MKDNIVAIRSNHSWTFAIPEIFINLFSILPPHKQLWSSVGSHYGAGTLNHTYLVCSSLIFLLIQILFFIFKCGKSSQSLLLMQKANLNFCNFFYLLRLRWFQCKDFAKVCAISFNRAHFSPVYVFIFCINHDPFNKMLFIF